MAIKKDKTGDVATNEQLTDKEPTASAPEAPALDETNQSANGADESQALDQDKTPPMGDDSLEQEETAGDEHPQAGGAGSETGLVCMRLDESLI